MRARHPYPLASVLLALAACSSDPPPAPRPTPTPSPTVEPLPDCDPDDPAEQTVERLFIDDDGDGYAAGPAEDFCVGPDGEEGLVATSLGEDCDDANGARWRYLIYGGIDDDLDGHAVAEEGEVCAGAALPDRYLAAASPDGDCDDADARVFVLADLYADIDEDGRGAGAPITRCTDGTLPPRYASADDDCAPDDATRWTPREFAFRDADGDGWTVTSTGTVCAGAALPAGFLASAARGPDCDDGDATAWRWVAWFADADGDGVGAGAPTIGCARAPGPAGMARVGGDPDDGDPLVSEDWDTLLAIILD